MPSIKLSKQATMAGCFTGSWTDITLPRKVWKYWRGEGRGWEMKGLTSHDTRSVIGQHSARNSKCTHLLIQEQEREEGA